MLTLALAALLTLTDPTGDLGDGTVFQPTAAVGRPQGALDVTQLEIYDAETLTFSLSFNSLSNPFKLRHGFTFPIIELYVDDRTGSGHTALLPGSGMRLPSGATWNYAFKLSGDALQIFEATPRGWQDVTARFQSTVTTQGNTIIVNSTLPRPKQFDAYGVVGSYTGFNNTGWMPLSRTRSPWAYSSETQVPAALDVIAPSLETQYRALASGVLPPITRTRSGANPWIFVMLAGILLAVTGIMLRFAPRAKTIEAAPPTTEPLLPSSTHPGPYRPDPLKPRGRVLKTLVEDVEPLPPSVPLPLTPGQQMAAERAKTMIGADRTAIKLTPPLEVMVEPSLDDLRGSTPTHPIQAEGQKPTLEEINNVQTNTPYPSSKSQTHIPLPKPPTITQGAIPRGVIPQPTTTQAAQSNTSNQQQGTSSQKFPAQQSPSVQINSSSVPAQLLSPNQPVLKQPVANQPLPSQQPSHSHPLPNQSKPQPPSTQTTPLLGEGTPMSEPKKPANPFTAARDVASSATFTDDMIISSSTIARFEEDVTTPDVKTAKAATPTTPKATRPKNSTLGFGASGLENWQEDDDLGGLDWLKPSQLPDAKEHNPFTDTTSGKKKV
ncbi:MAG: glucodextranase DOMON-like domain-containing protein [Trueperaceae bacterium]